MKDIARRNSLKAGMATVVASALAGTARDASAHESPKTPFTVSQTSIPILDSQAVFPVRRIYCIGRNYAAHAREMGSDPSREPPFFFQKPTDAIQFIAPGTVGDHPYPSLTKNYHYRSSWSLRSSPVAKTSRSTRRWSMCTATHWAWI